VCRDCCECNPLNDKLNPICHLLALLRAQRILHVSRIRVNNQIFDKYSIFIHSEKTSIKNHDFRSLYVDTHIQVSQEEWTKLRESVPYVKL